MDKENFARAVKMFADGLLPYDMATGKDPINVAEYRNTVAKNLHEFRRNQQEKVKEAMKQHRKIVDYYTGCKRLTLHNKENKAISDVVFVKDGHLVGDRFRRCRLATQEDIENYKREQRCIFLRNKISTFFKSEDKRNSLTIEELEKIGSIIKTKMQE